MIDASDKRLTAWIASLPPRQELVVRMALRDRAINCGPHWAPRIDVLMDQLRINSEAKLAKLLREVRNADAVIDRNFA